MLTKFRSLNPFALRNICVFFPLGRKKCEAMENVDKTSIITSFIVQLEDDWDREKNRVKYYNERKKKVNNNN